MTLKPISQMHRKLVLIRYLLLTATIATINGHLLVQTADYSGLVIQFSPDLLDDRSLVSTLRYYNASGEEAGLSINISGSEPNSTTSKCIVPFRSVHQANNFVKISQRPVRRLTKKTVLLVARELDQSRDLKLVLVNTQHCKYHYAYGSALPEKYFIFTSDNSQDERFALIMQDNKNHCEGHNLCRLLFDGSEQQLQVLDFDFPPDQFVDIEPAKSFAGNLFVVRLTDDSNTHIMRLYDLSKDSPYKQLTSLPSYANIDTSLNSLIQHVFGFSHDIPSARYQVKTSGLSLCWTLRGQRPTIHCSAFKDDSSLKFNQTIVYPDLMDISSVTAIPNGLVLLSTKSHCVDKDDCSVVQVAVIAIDDSNSMHVKHRQYKFASDFVVALKIQLNESNGKIELEYLCMLEDKGLSHHFIQLL